jgi:hypothetical protein
MHSQALVYLNSPIVIKHHLKHTHIRSKNAGVYKCFFESLVVAAVLYFK